MSSQVGLATPSRASIPALHALEPQRLAALRRLKVLDTPAEARFDRVTRLVSSTLDVETVLVSLVDENRQWFKSACNLNASETERDIAFCAHAINEPSDRLVIPDATKDPRFANNPLVTGAPKIRAYAGVVLRSEDGLPLGTLCAICYEPREFDEAFLRNLSDFAEIVSYELRRSSWGLDGTPRSKPHLQAVPSAGNETQVDTTDFTFDTLMEMRAFLCVIAITVRIPRIDSLAKAYGNQIAEELIAEVERRLKLAIKNHPHRIEKTSKGALSIMVGVDKDSDRKALTHLKSLFTENLGIRIQTETVTIATPIRIGFSQSAKASCNTADLFKCAMIAYENVVGTQAGPVFETYDTRMGEIAGRYQTIAETIVPAMKANELVIHYQAKVDVASNSVAGLEALIRWDHPDLGPVSPPEILKVLADKEMIPELDYWVLGAVCDQIRRWSFEGRHLLPISVNICGTTLFTQDFPQKASQILSDRNIPVDLIEIEVLESTIIDESTVAFDQIEQCQKLGLSVALDDFGAGQTSLAYLGRLTVDTVKIDQSFVNNIVKDATASNLIFRIISMCKSLGKTTIVEGVETVGQYLLLRSFGCDQIQGYYFGKPDVADKVSVLLSEEGKLLTQTDLDHL